MLATVAHILPLTTIHRERLLPVHGRVVVRRSQEVVPKDVVAEAVLAPKHLILDIAKGLGVPVGRTDSLIKKSTGQVVSEGDVIAGPVGLTRRVVRAPAPGRIVLVGDGQVLIEIDSPPYELQAGFAGTVVELIAGRGVVIEATGALVQGAWGNNRMDFGLIQVKLQDPADELTLDQVDVSLRGAIVVGGYCGDAGVLRSASDIPLRGLVLSSMPASLVPLAERMRFPILVLEGFGRRPMNSAAFNLLTTNQNREVSINAEPYDPFKGTRPEMLIPLPGSSSVNPPVASADFSPGQQVRIVQSNNAAKVATLESISTKPLVFPSGLKAIGAEVVMEDGDRVMIPLENLEVLA
jgi:hypothetical protein